MGAEDMQGPPQWTATPPLVGEPSGGLDQPAIQHADPPGMAAHGSAKASTAGQPGTEPEEAMPDTGREAGLHLASAHGAQPAGRAGAAPLANPAHHTNASASEETPPRDSPGTCAKSEIRETTPYTPKRAASRETLPSEHNRDQDSLDAFMESRMGDPHTVPTLAAPRVRLEERRDHAECRPLRMSREAHLQRNYTALGRTGHSTATADGHAAASGAADQTPDGRSAPGSGARVKASTNTASETTGPPPGTAPPWGRGHLDYTRLDGDASRPSDQAEQAAAQDLGLWINGLTAEEQLALAVCIRWLLTSRSCHLTEGTRTMADITFRDRTGHTPPATMKHPDEWHYVTTRLMAHMGAYSPDEMIRLHWQWHQRAALRIRMAMQQHDIWDIPVSPGYQGHTTGQRQLRSQDVPEPPGQAVRRNSPERRRGPRAGMGSPSGTYRSPLQPFAQVVLTPPGGKAARQNSAKRQGTLAPPAAAAARRLPRHGESSSMRIPAGTIKVPTTPAPTGRHLPPIPDADLRGHARSRRTSPPFSRQPSASDWRRFTRAPTGQQTERPAHPPPPSQGWRPTCSRGDSTPQTRSPGSPRPTKGLRKGWGDSRPNIPPCEQAR